MGNFRIEINAVGGHGRDRTKKDGEVVNFFEGGNTTPDAIAKLMVEMMKVYGTNVQSATITHWPGEPSQVEDDLITGVRKGSF